MDLDIWNLSQGEHSGSNCKNLSECSIARIIKVRKIHVWQYLIRDKRERTKKNVVRFLGENSGRFRSWWYYQRGDDEYTLLDRLPRAGTVLRWNHKPTYENKSLEQRQNIWTGKDNLRVVNTQVNFQSSSVENLKEIMWNEMNTSI